MSLWLAMSVRATVSFSLYKKNKSPSVGRSWTLIFKRLAPTFVRLHFSCSPLESLFKKQSNFLYTLNTRPENVPRIGNESPLYSASFGRAQRQPGMPQMGKSPPLGQGEAGGASLEPDVQASS